MFAHLITGMVAGTMIAGSMTSHLFDMFFSGSLDALLQATGNAALPDVHGQQPIIRLGRAWCHQTLYIILAFDI